MLPEASIITPDFDVLQSDLEGKDVIKFAEAARQAYGYILKHEHPARTYESRDLFQLAAAKQLFESLDQGQLRFALAYTAPDAPKTVTQLNQAINSLSDFDPLKSFGLNSEQVDARRLTLADQGVSFCPEVNLEALVLAWQAKDGIVQNKTLPEGLRLKLNEQWLREGQEFAGQVEVGLETGERLVFSQSYHWQKSQEIREQTQWQKQALLQYEQKDTAAKLNQKVVQEVSTENFAALAGRLFVDSRNQATVAWLIDFFESDDSLSVNIKAAGFTKETWQDLFAAACGGELGAKFARAAQTIGFYDAPKYQAVVEALLQAGETGQIQVIKSTAGKEIEKDPRDALPVFFTEAVSFLETVEAVELPLNNERIKNRIRAGLGELITLNRINQTNRYRTEFDRIIALAKDKGVFTESEAQAESARFLSDED